MMERNISISFRPIAMAELEEARQWYNQRRAGLGDELVAACEAAIDQIRRHPFSGPAVHRDIRRILVRRFPYGIHYIVEDDTIVVLAVFHAKRNPREWKRRR